MNPTSACRQMRRSTGIEPMFTPARAGSSSRTDHGLLLPFQPVPRRLQPSVILKP